MKTCYLLSKLLLITFISLVGGKLSASSLPDEVHISIQVTPPYTPYLSDYISEATHKMRVTINYSSVFQHHDAKLRFTLRGEDNGVLIQSKPMSNVPNLALKANRADVLSGDDLAPYFYNYNLVFAGFSRQSYIAGKALPAGMYSLCVEVIVEKKGRTVTISNVACDQLWIEHGQPPVIDAPMCGDAVVAQGNQNVLFQWTPMHGLNNAPDTEYELTIVEMRPKGVSANQALLSIRPLFQGTTTGNTFLYGLNEPRLIPGMQYAFRVQAKSNTIPFVNQGFSEVCTFTYVDESIVSAPKQLIYSVKDKKILLNWERIEGVTQYEVRYRQIGNKAWKTKVVMENELMLKDLLPGEAYEYQVKSIAGGLSSDFSITEVFEVPEKEL